MEVIKAGNFFFSSIRGAVSLSIAKPNGFSLIKKSFTLQPPIFDAIEILALPAISFRNRGFLSFSNLGLMLIIASSASGCCFKTAAILVLALMIMFIIIRGIKKEHR